MWTRSYPRLYYGVYNQQDKGDDPPPPLNPAEATSGVLCAVLGSPVQKNYEAPKQSHWKATKMIKRLKRLSSEERLRELGQFSLEMRRLRGDLINVYKYSKRGYQQGEGRLSCVMVGKKTIGNSLKLKHSKFYLHMRKNFTVRMAEDWSRVPREPVVSPSMEIFKTCLDAILGNVL